LNIQVQGLVCLQGADTSTQPAVDSQGHKTGTIFGQGLAEVMGSSLGKGCSRAVALTDSRAMASSCFFSSKLSFSGIGFAPFLSDPFGLSQLYKDYAALPTIVFTQE